MLALVLTGSLEEPHVALRDIAAPEDAPGRAVIEVFSAGITRGELRWNTSWRNADGTPREQPCLLGLEFSGRIRSLGSDVRGFAVGQDVMGMLDPFHAGAMAETVSVAADHLLAMPTGISHEAASTLPLSGQTAWQALIRHGQLKHGQRVLIHGGAGAVGTFAIQIARWVGAYIVVTASAKDEALCRSLGADQFVDYQHEHFESHGGDYDLIFDQIGGDVQERSWAVLKRGGKLVTIAGEAADAPDLERARAMGVTARFFIVEHNVDDLRSLSNLVAGGEIRAIIGHRFQLVEAATAFGEGFSTFAGKAILICSKRPR